MAWVDTRDVALDSASRSIVLTTAVLWIVLGIVSVLVQADRRRKAIGGLLILLGVCALSVARWGASLPEVRQVATPLALVVCCFTIPLLAPQSSRRE